MINVSDKICSSLRIAEDVLKEGVLIKSFPPESYTIKCLDDAWALLDTEDGQERMEGYLKTWMKSIMDLLVESEQLRIEKDKNGPQVEVEYWKARAAKLTLLVEQIISMPCKMTLVTLRAGKCKLLKVQVQFSNCVLIIIGRLGMSVTPRLPDIMLRLVTMLNILEQRRNTAMQFT